MKTLLLVAICMFLAQDANADWFGGRRSRSKGPVTSTCPRYGMIGDCEFYRCFESRHRCGSGGYPLQYGYRYCRRFTDRLHAFTSEGANFVERTRQCLTRSLLTLYPSGTATCSGIHSFAIGSHSHCYVTSGICNIIRNPRDIAALWDVYEMRDFANLEAQRQVWQTALRCGRMLGRGALEDVNRISANIIRYFQRRG